MGRSELSDLDRPPDLRQAEALLRRRSTADTQRAAAWAFALWSVVLVVLTPFLGALAGPTVAVAAVAALGYTGWNLAPELRPAGLASLVALCVAALSLL